VLALTAAGVLLADLVSKILVVAELLGRPPVTLPGGFLWLTHARNPGAAFSFAEGATVLFTAVAAAVIAVIARTASKLRSTAWAISLGLVLGGAAGNLVDRLFRSPGPLRGHVVDWISLRTPDGRMLFPIFNLADSGIVCGGILAVLLAVLGYEMDGSRSGSRRDPTPGPDAAGPGPVRPGTPAGPVPTGPGPVRPATPPGAGGSGPLDPGTPAGPGPTGPDPDRSGPAAQRGQPAGGAAGHAWWPVPEGPGPGQAR